ncbi:DNA binding protein [PinkBerry-associated phage LS06-2018-MD08]|nr:DNA binding protein [PinkBerry-associated phage LS06-2018-MD08]
MIKELLERNGINISFIVEAMRVDYNEIVVTINEYRIFGLSFFTRNIEQACRKYVKENGFKLEWLYRLGLTKERLFKMLKKDQEDFMWQDFLKFKTLNRTQLKNLWEIGIEYKIIAWLYANDIEVVE